MTETIRFEAGGYRYVPSVFQYSAAVAALEGFEIERAVFRRPAPLAEGFTLVARHLAALGRPTTAFAACELRSPAPFTDQGFEAFNRLYVGTLERWGIFRDGANPVARTNVCPLYDTPAEPMLHAFSYTVPAPGGPGRGSIIAGSGEAPEGPGPYAARTIRYGQTHPEALAEKLGFVLGEMERRLGALGLGWDDATQPQLYTVQDVGHLLGPLFGPRGALRRGVTWHYARPPVVGLDVEMDVLGHCRSVVL
jgi:hypothetical protein